MGSNKLFLSKARFVYLGCNTLLALREADELADRISLGGRNGGHGKWWTRELKLV